MTPFRRSLPVPFLLLALLWACVSDQEKFGRAVEKDSIPALETFLRENPGTPYADEARKRLEALYFKRAERSGTVGGYEEFLRLQESGYFAPSRKTAAAPAGTEKDEYAVRSKEAIVRLGYEERFQEAKRRDEPRTWDRFLNLNPEGPRTKEAKRLRENSYFEEARRDGTIPAYYTYLKEFPEGEHAGAAHEAIERGVWEKTVSDNTASGYERFLKTYPASRFAAEARRSRQRIEVADWETARSADTVEMYTKFLEVYPNSEFAPEGKRRIEALDWEKARSEGKPEGYLAFLERHPAGEHAKEARIRLDRVMVGILAANVKKVSLRIHRKEEPFPGDMVFLGNPFLSGEFKTKDRPGQIEIEKPLPVEMRRPPKGEVYVVLTVALKVVGDFPAEVALETADGKRTPPHLKRIAPASDALDRGLPAWVGTRSTVITFRKGASGKIGFLWIVPEEKLRGAAVFFGGRRYPLREYMEIQT